MDEARAGVGLKQRLHTPAYLFVVFRRETFHHDRHRPWHVVADMRTADACSCLAAEEAGVVVAPHKAAGVLINRVIDVYIAHISHTEERWHIGIVHQETVAETVHLISVYLAVFRMVVNGIFLQGCLHFGCQFAASLCHQEDFRLSAAIRLACTMVQNLSCLVHRRHRHEV